MFIDIIRLLETSETLWLQLLSSFCIVFTHFRNSSHNSMIPAVQQQSPQIRLHSFPQLSHIKRQISETRHDPPGFRIISRRYTQEIMQKSVFWYSHQVSLHRFWYCRCSFYFSKSDESASDSAYIKSDIWRLFEICYKNLKQRLNVSDKSGSCFIHQDSCRRIPVEWHAWRSDLFFFLLCISFPHSSYQVLLHPSPGKPW